MAFLDSVHGFGRGSNSGGFLDPGNGIRQPRTNVECGEHPAPVSDHTETPSGIGTLPQGKYIVGADLAGKTDGRGCNIDSARFIIEILSADQNTRHKASGQVNRPG